MDDDELVGLGMTLLLTMLITLCDEASAELRGRIGVVVLLSAVSGAGAGAATNERVLLLGLD
jgi:hypothetical protein